MALLDRSDLDHMLAVRPRPCHECHTTLRWNYCRVCDEYFWSGHAEACPAADVHETENHRSYAHVIAGASPGPCSQPDDGEEHHGRT